MPIHARQAQEERRAQMQNMAWMAAEKAVELLNRR